MGVAVSSVMAQTTQRHYSFNDDKTQFDATITPNEVTASPKALGITFWTNDFSTPGDWVTDNAGQAAPFGWNVGTTVNSWWAAFSGGINSTSGGEFAEVNNGDYNLDNQAVGVEYYLTLASPIDVLTLAGTDQVTLSFEQYGALFNDGHEVQVSTDGSTWQTVYTNNDRDVFVGNNPAAIFANPETVSVNIAPEISGGASTVWIRFFWNSRFSTQTNLDAWTTFGWFIDDVALTTNPDNDLAATEPYWGSAGLNYYQIPTSQIAPIDFSVIAENNGIADQTNSTLSVDINSGGFTGTSGGITIPAGTVDTLELTTPYTPAATPGSHAFTWTLTQTEIDDLPANNLLTGDVFEVTDFVYARDNGVRDDIFDNNGDGYILGLYYDAFAATNVYSLDVFVATGTSVGSEIYALIYSLDPNATTFADALILEDQSSYYQIENTDVNGFINLDFENFGQNGTPLISGETYFVAIGSDGGDVSIGTAGETFEQTCFTYDVPLDTWFFTTRTPMIRMNFDPASSNVGIDENNNDLGINVYPNPAQNDVTINYALGNGTDVTIEIVDIAGKVITTLNEGTQSTGAHNVSLDASAFATGVYYVNILTENGKATKKFVKN